MSTKLGTLTLDLLVKLGSFEQGMDQAERKTKKTTENMGKAFDNFKTEVIGALGGSEIGAVIDAFNTKIDVLNGGVVAATGALAGMAVGGVAVAIGALSKLSIETAKADAQLLVLADRANTSIKNFQVLQYASQGLGVTQEQLGAILADTQEKLGEFSASAAGGAADFFDALKNNTKLTDDQIKEFVKTLQKKDGVDAIQALNNEMDKLGVTSQERRFILESLASDLGNLAPLFAENGQAIRAFDEALTKAGLITTKESAEQSQLLAAQVQAVNLQYQGWKKELVTGFMPAMIDVANAFFGASENGQQLQTVGQGVGSVLKSVAKVALGLSATFTVAGKLIGGVAAAIAALKGEKINTINMMFEDIEGTLANYGERIDSLSIVNDSATNSTNQLTNAILSVNQASKESTEGLKVNTKEAEENAKAKEKQAKAEYKYTQAQLVQLQKVAKISAENGLNEIGAKYGLPQNLLAAVMMQESKGDVKARSATGAIGPFQTTGIYRKQYGLSVADSYDVKKSAEVAAKDISESFKVFGNWKDAVTAYNAGREGTKQLNAKGFTGSAAKTKEAKEYVGLVDKWLAGLNGGTGFLGDGADTKGTQEYLNYLETLERERKQIRDKYAIEFSSDDIKRQIEYNNQVFEISKAFQGEELQHYLTIAKTRYEEAQKLADMQFAWEVTEHRLTEEEKLRYSYKIKQQEIQSATQLTTEQRGQKLKALQEQFNQEFAMFKLAQEKQLLEMKRNWMTAGEYASQYYAIVKQEILNTPSYSPDMQHTLIKEANFNQGLEENSEREQVWGDYQSQFGATDSPYQQDMDLLAEARKQMLITEEEFQQKRLALQTAYGAQYGGEFAGMLMGLVDQSSSAYAILGGIQKSAALFSTAMNSYTAISAAWASAPFPYNLPAVGMATMETGLLQAAVSALSPTVGMAHDGIDNVPKEGTWLLDKGERVVDSRTNADLKGYLQDARSQNASGANIVINVPPGYTAQRSQQGDREVIDIVERYIGQQIQNPNSNLMKGITKKTTATVRR